MYNVASSVFNYSMENVEGATLPDYASQSLAPIPSI